MANGKQDSLGGGIDSKLKGSGNGDGSVGVQTAKRQQVGTAGYKPPAQQTSTGSQTLAQKDASNEKRKRIEQLVKELFHKAGEAAKEDPNEAVRLYKQAEYAALSEGRGRLGKLYVRVAQTLGVVSLETELKKEKARLDSIVKDYRRATAHIESEMNEVSKKSNKLKAERDKTYELDDLIKDEIRDEQTQLVEMDDKYQTLKSGKYTQETISEMNKLRDEARKKKAYIAKLQERQVENSIKYQNVERETEDTEGQLTSLRDQMDKTKIDMYTVMQEQTPTTYMMMNIKGWKISYQTSNQANAICQKIRKLSEAARGASATLELASYQSHLSTDNSEQDGQYGELLTKRDEVRKDFAAIRKDILAEFTAQRQTNQQNDSLL